MLLFICCSDGQELHDAFTDEKMSGPRRHSMHEVGLLQTSAHIVSTQFLPPEMGARFRFLDKSAVAPCRLAGSVPHKSGGRRVKSWPDDTHKHTPVIWTCDLCNKQINKKQTSIRCNHTHNKHWVHLKCTHIKQRQYNHDWRCTIHTPTQKVTATPTHLQTTINQRTNTLSYFKST